MLVMNYFKTFNDYKERLKTKKSKLPTIVKSIQSRSTLEDKYRDIMTCLVVYAVYKNKSEEALNSINYKCKGELERQLSVCSKILKLPVEKFDIAFVCMGNAFNEKQKSIMDIFNYIDYSSVDELNKIKLSKIKELSYLQTRKFLSNKESADKLTCAICGKDFDITEFHFGSKTCKYCHNDKDKRAKKIQKDKQQQINEDAEYDAIISDMKNCSRKEEKHKDTFLDIINAINEMRAFYDGICESLVRLAVCDIDTYNMVSGTISNINELLKKEVSKNGN